VRVCVCARCVVQESLDCGMDWMGRIATLSGIRPEGFVGFNAEVIRVIFTRMCTWVASLAQPTAAGAVPRPAGDAGAAGAAASTSPVAAVGATAARPAGPAASDTVAAVGSGTGALTGRAPVTLSSLSATCVRVFLLYLLECNIAGGALKVKQAGTGVGGGAAGVASPAGAAPASTMAAPSAAVDGGAPLSMTCFPVSGMMVEVTPLPKGGCNVSL
jgi:hypothetical protein